MLTNFLNNTLYIIEKQTTMSWWEQVITDNPIYTWIKCHYYSYTATLKATDSSLNTDKTQHKVIVEPDKTNIRKGMYITINDADLWEIGTFIIEWVKMNRLIDWSNDSLELKIKAIW